MASSELLVIGLALVPALLWGFSPVLSKRGMAGGGSALQASLIVVIVDGTIYWLALALGLGGNAFAGATTYAIGVFIVAGVVGTALGRLATFTGVHRVGASINSAGISTRPMFATVLALVWLGEPVELKTAVGVLVLVVGLVVLALGKGGDIRGWRTVDLFFPLAAASLFAIGNVIRRYGLTRTALTPLEAVAINEAAAFVVLAAYVVASGRRDIFAAPKTTYLYFSGSALFTAVALLALFAAFAMEGGRVALVDPLTATAPLFTTLFAFFLLKDLERVTRAVVAGAGLIVVGAALITL